MAWQVTSFTPSPKGKIENRHHAFGAGGSLVLEVLCYKPQGRDSIPDEVIEFSQFT
jgi:hypothetical protein